MPRNSSGVYALPAGNPVVSNTLIETNWANPTMSDIGQALTESLDRYGRGGMLAPFRIADGTVVAPSLAFASETSTGVYRSGAGTWNLSVLGTQVMSAQSGSVTVTPPVAFSGGFSAIGTANFSGTTNFTGAINVTNGTPPQTTVRSGGAGLSCYFDIGRTAADILLGVAGTPNTLSTGDIPGDATVRATQRLYLSILGSPHVRIDAASGVNAVSGFNATGQTLSTVPVISMVRLGVTGNFPYIQMVNPNAAANNRFWDQYADTSTLYYRVVNDTFSTPTTWMSIVRSGVTVSSINFGATTITAPSSTLSVGGLVGFGAAPLAGVNLRVQTGANRNVAVLDQFSNATISALTDAGAATVLRVAGNPILFSGNGSTEHMRLTTTGLGIFTVPSYALDVNGLVFRIADGVYDGILGKGSGVVSGGATTGFGIRSNTGPIYFSAGVAGALQFTMDAAGRFSGRFLHNNASGINGVAEQYIGSRDVAQTLVSVTNVTAATDISQVRAIRVGNSVVISGRISVTPTAASTSTEVQIVLPVTSNIASPFDITGSLQVAPPGVATDLQILGDPVTDRLRVLFRSGGAGSSIDLSYVAVYAVYG